MATYDAGIVTAYGAAVRGGYTGTYEEFCAQQANYAQNAAAVEQAKQDAQAAAQDASESAETLSESVAQIATNTQDISSLKEDSSLLDDRVTALEEGGSGSGLTEDIKTALLQIARKVAYVDDQGQTYYDDLYDALYAVTAIHLDARSIMLTSIGSTQQLTATTTPPGGAVTWASSDTSIATVSNTGLVTSVGYGSCTITASSGSVSATCAVAVSQVTLTSIAAYYQQSGAVYDTASLDSLKSDLTVTATYSDSSTATVTEYTLTGTLTAGTSTITVSYGGKTTTFNVAVTAAPTLSSISAVYTQSGTVYDTDALDSLRADLVVTATYSDQSTETVTAYTLNGTLVEGTSTITVTYGSKTTTFNVTVSSRLILNWDLTQSLTDTKSGRTVSLRGTNGAKPTQNSTGLVFDGETQNADFGSLSPAGKTIEIDVASFQFAGDTAQHIRFVMSPSAGNRSGYGALLYRANNGWQAYGKNATGTNNVWSGNYSGLGGNTDAVRNIFNGKTVKLVFGSDSNSMEVFLNDESKGTINNVDISAYSGFVIGGGYSGWSSGNGDQCYNMTITGVRVYTNE